MTRHDSHDERTATELSRRDMLAKTGAAVGGVSLLAGCSGLLRKEFEATPVGLTRAGRAYFNLPEADHEKLTEKRSAPGDVGSVTVTSHLTVYRRPRDHELPRRFSTPDPAARTVGALATPAVELAGQRLNPLAKRPLESLVDGRAGRRLLERTDFVDSADFEWKREPERVGTEDGELLETETTVESYFGVVAESDGPGTAVLMSLARLEIDGDVVIAGEFQGRQVASGSPGGGCNTSRCTLKRDTIDNNLTRFTRGGRSWTFCPPGIQDASGDQICFPPDGGGRDWDDGDDDRPDPEIPPREKRVHVGLKNVRLVQEVENTTVVNPNTNTVVHREGDPTLVSGQETAVVFELTGFKNLHKLNAPIDIRITRPSQGGTSSTSERFTLSPQDLKRIKSGDHTIAVLHENANDNDASNDLPVFPLYGPYPKISVEVAPIDLDVLGGYEIAAGHKHSNIQTLRPLRVGFIGIQDPGNGSNYGTQNGNPRAFTRSVNSAVEYIQRSFPGDVVGYAHQAHWLKGTQSLYKDFKHAKTVLDRLAANTSYPSSGPGFPKGGKLYNNTDDSRSAVISDIRNQGFDVTVAVCPNNDSSNSGATSYFDYHNRNWGGVYTGHNRAVAYLGADPSNQDRWASTVAAQEIGHYFQHNYRHPTGHPMAQRDNDGSDTQVNNVPVDSAHARHQGSDLRDRDTDGDGTIEVNNPPDPPGVISTGYDLEDDSFDNVQSFTLGNGNFDAKGPNSGASSIGTVPSFMSYHWDQTRKWTDTRIHQDFIDREWNWRNQIGSGNPAPMLTASIDLSGTGDALYEDVATYRGFERYVDHDEGAVEVTVHGPEGEVLERARVSDRVHVSHGETVEDRTSVTIPFPEGAAAVRTTYEGRSSRMNPIERGVRDAVGRVPESAFRGVPETVREEIYAALDRVADLMDEGAYAEAADVMDGDVREAVSDGIGSHDEGLGAPTGDELIGLVDEMTDRLETLAEATG